MMDTKFCPWCLITDPMRKSKVEYRVNEGIQGRKRATNISDKNITDNTAIRMKSYLGAGSPVATHLIFTSSPSLNVCWYMGPLMMSGENLPGKKERSSNQNHAYMNIDQSVQLSIISLQL